MDKRYVLRALIAAVTLAGLIMPANRAEAAGTVGNGTPGSCTEAAFDTALAGGGVITFSCGAAPFFLVLTTMKTINVDTTINGGSPVTLDGADFIQLFTVPSGHSLTIQNLTLSHAKNTFSGAAITNEGNLTVVNSTLLSNTVTGLGAGGAAIFNDGNLTITNGSFINNTAGSGGFGGAIENSGSLTISGGYFSGNAAPGGFGGAIENTSSVTISGSYFTGNTAGDGGAIETSTTMLNIGQTTFFKNSATNFGGAIAGQGMTVTTSTFDSNSAPSAGAISGAAGTSISQSTFSSNDATSSTGGALENIGTPNTVTDSTFYGNHAATNGAAIYNNGGLTVNNSTIAGSTGGDGIYNATSRSITLENTILVNNTTVNCFNAGTLTSGGNNLDSGSSCNLTATGDLSGVDPMLGPLANNGGPTLTMALLPGSPAIDAGSNVTCASVDQRGVTRPQGGVCDIGAYELRALSFTSSGAFDGWVLETGKGTNLGGSLNSTGSKLNVGDDGSNRRMRGFLSFNTSLLPDGATAVMAKLQVKQQAIFGNPFGTQGLLLADLARPFFGADLSLVSTDWQAHATVLAAGTFDSVATGGWYTALLGAPGLANINTKGKTQFRLRFSSDAYNRLPDFLTLFSGDSAALSRPRLTVYYTP